MTFFPYFFFQLMSAVKTGAWANIRLETALSIGERKVIPTYRSGGGL